MASIHSLPAEIHLKILKHAISLFKSHESSSSSSRNPRPYRWLRLTFVCSYWRSLCLEYPFFWDTLFLLRAECVEEILRRSEMKTKEGGVMVPLTLRVDTSKIGMLARKMYGDTGNPLEHVDPRERFRELDLKHMLRTIAPVLPRVYETTLIGDPEPLLEQFFLQYPKQRLILQDSSFTCSEPLYNAPIKHLEINNSVIPPGQRNWHFPPWALRKVERTLTALHLTDALPFSWFSYFRTPQDNINLPSLRELQLEDTGRVMVLFLKSINFPRDARVLLDVSEEGCKKDTLDWLAFALNAKLSVKDGETGLPGYVKIGIDVPYAHHSKCTTIHGWRDIPKDQELEDLRIAIPNNSFTPKTTRYLFPAAHALSLRLGDHADTSELGRALREAKEVKTLELDGWSAGLIKEVLMGGGSGGGEWVFPHLHTLILAGCSPRTKGGPAEELKEVRDLLEERSTACGKLDLLEFQFEHSGAIELEGCAREVCAPSVTA